jgi:hypothetical protein
MRLGHTEAVEPAEETQSMRMFDAEKQVISDLREEGTVVTMKQLPLFTIIVVRHPTLGKLVLVEGHDGHGAVVEVDN